MQTARRRQALCHSSPSTKLSLWSTPRDRERRERNAPDNTYVDMPTRKLMPELAQHTTEKAVQALLLPLSNRIDPATSSPSSPLPNPTHDRRNPKLFTRRHEARLAINGPLATTHKFRLVRQGTKREAVPAGSHTKIPVASAEAAQVRISAYRGLPCPACLGLSAVPAGFLGGEGGSIGRCGGGVHRFRRIGSYY